MSYMYTNNVGYSEDVNATIGKFDKPISVIIEDETDLCRKREGFDKAIYNVATSDSFAESYFLENELGILSAVSEGEAGIELSSKELYKQYVEHTEFKGDCFINKTLIEDSNRNEIAKRVRKLIRSYWMTRNEFAQRGLFEAENPTMQFAGKTFKLTTPDGLPLFHKLHPFMNGNAFQSNVFYHIHEGSVDSGVMESLLSALAILGRQMLTEDGKPRGFCFNTIYIPSNRWALEAAIRRVIGTQNINGYSSNNVGIMSGGWKLVVLPLWTSSTDKFIIGSDEANRNDCGSMFYDRTPFQVTRNDQFDINDNVLIHGRARMSLVHNNYKHFMLCHIVDYDSSYEYEEKATKIEL